MFTRRLALAGLAALALAAPAAAAGPLLGITGDSVRFQGQTGQSSTIRQAFLAWGQGLSSGSPFAALIPAFGPVPMLHLGTKTAAGAEAITPGAIAGGKGDAYLVALNQGIAQWGRAIYVRPLAEMNNPGNPWSAFTTAGKLKDADHSPASYRKAFARIYLIVHGGPIAAVNAKLAQLGLPPVRGAAGGLATNPFPRVRVVWSPLAGGTPKGAENAPAAYWPGAAYVDVGGGDIYDEAGTAPWGELDALYTLVRSHKKPFAVPEWGLWNLDDAAFVQRMCAFLKEHPATENEVFYESKPGSIFDLGTKPESAKAYRACITPLAGALPAWAQGGPGGAKQLALSLTPSPAAGDAPLQASFAIEAKLSVPIVQWQLVFGDGAQAGSSGAPPASIDHTYAKDGVYQATLIVYQGPPFTGTAIRFLTSASVTVGSGAKPLVQLIAKPSSGPHPLAVSYQLEANLPRPVASWQIVNGDGTALQGTGRPPHFTGHTFAKAGSYRVLFIVDEAPPFSGTVVRFITYADIRVG